MKAAELREKSVADLQVELEALLKKQFDDRMQLAAGQLDNTAEVRRVRRSIARVRTIINEKSKAS